jgi:hypothetical protein
MENKEPSVEQIEVYHFEYEDFTIIYDSGYFFIHYYDEEDTEIEELLDTYLENKPLEFLEKKGFDKNKILEFLERNFQ